MENTTPEEILALLADTDKISSVSIYGSKVIAYKNITDILVVPSIKLKQAITFLHCTFQDIIMDNTLCEDSLEFKQCTFSKDFRI